MKLLLTFAYASALWAASVGPSKGHLIVAGGGALGPEIVNKFIDLAGGPDGLIVYIPTADERDTFPADFAKTNFLAKAGARNIVVLHTRDKQVADTADFAKPLQQAKGVWFAGGRQWRLVDSYLNTRVHRELEALLKRGGVIGGTSAGATIQGSFLVRGARSGNTVMVDPTYQIGMAFLRNVAVDQHLLTRKREKDLVDVVAKYPKLLGIGIDEGTAILVESDRFQVLGKSKVAIYERGKEFYWLNAGERFDLKKRKKL